MIKKFLTILCIITACTAPVFAVPANGNKMVKVGISDAKFQNYYFTKTVVSATDRFRLIDKSTNSLVSEFDADTKVKIEIKDNLFTVSQEDDSILAKNLAGPIVVESANGYVTVADLKRAGKPAYYRGVFEITKVPKKDNQFNVINILDVESYLKGVVPNEMPVRFGLEALKAQAVLARNYVLKPRERNYHNFDVCDSVACQVYYGANTEQELSDRAVFETEDIVAMNEGELILALYSSTAGGYTESFENAFSTDLSNGTRLFPGAPKPYLKGVPDKKDIPVLSDEKAAREFYTTEPKTFDNASPYFRWKKEWEKTELENILKKTLKTQSAAGFVYPKFTNPEDFGSLKDIKVSRRGVSGKAMCVDIYTDKGKFSVQKELPIRRAFQKNNISLPSANVVFDFVTEKPDSVNKHAKPVTKIIAQGGGFGHGVGMSQYGAGEMAKQGYGYEDIIQHYFTNTAITTFPVELSNKTGKDTASQIFYTKEKKAFLVVENKFQFTKLTIVLNGKELRVEMIPSLFGCEKFDISKYIKKGENKITYILPYSDLHKKPVRVYVEIREAANEQ